MSNWKYRVYQLPFSVMESLSMEGKPTPFLYWGNATSDSPHEFTQETARSLYERNGYVEVARFNVQKMDDVFDVSNNPYRDEAECEALIDRIKPMHSVSVGDIIFDTESNEHYIVAPFGFDSMGTLRRAV